MLATSLQSGTTSESIRYELTEGYSYWLRVDPYGASESGYELFLSFAPDSSENDSDSKSGSDAGDTDQEDADLDDSDLDDNDSKSGSDSSEDFIGGIEIGDAGTYSFAANVTQSLLTDNTTAITGSVGYGEDHDDYFKFTPTNSGQLTASLSGLQDNINLKILDSDTNLLVSSTSGGTSDEQIVYDLNGGSSYWVRVDPFAASESEYRLDLAFLPASETASAEIIGTLVDVDSDSIY